MPDLTPTETYDRIADRAGIKAATAALDAEIAALDDKLYHLRRERREAAAKAARFQPGDRVIGRLYRGDAEVLQIEGYGSAGGYYDARRIRKDGQPYGGSSHDLLFGDILGPAPE